MVPALRQLTKPTVLSRMDGHAKLQGGRAWSTSEKSVQFLDAGSTFAPSKDVICWSLRSAACFCNRHLFAIGQNQNYEAASCFRCVADLGVIFPGLLAQVAASGSSCARGLGNNRAAARRATDLGTGSDIGRIQQR